MNDRSISIISYREMWFFLLFLPIIVNSQSCNPGAIYNQQYNRCYSFFATPKQFSIAEQNCASIGAGGHLVSISNAYENFLVEENAQQTFPINVTDFWIGANDLVTTGQWAWTDGKNFLFTKWAAGQPSTGDCGASSMTDGTWHTSNCATQKSYVCASPPIPAVTCPPIPTCPVVICPTQPQCTQRPIPSHCDSEWTYFQQTDSCYKVFYEAKWGDGEAYCVEQGAHMTSVHSMAENTFIANMAATRLTQDKEDRLTWLGLHFAGNKWQWTDNSNVDYTNWAHKKPDNPGKYSCGQIAQDKSHDDWYEVWNNEECNVQMRAYVCKKPAYH